MKYLFLLLSSISCFAQGFGSFDLDQPFFAGRYNATISVAGNILLYDSYNGVRTKTGTLVDNDFVTAWTNTAPGGNHAYDLMSLTNSKSWGNTSTNPIYRATWNPAGGAFIDISQTSNGFNYATIASTNCPLISAPYTTFLVFQPVNVSSAAAPFNHAIWSSTGDDDIGDQGMQDSGSPPWITRNVNDCSVSTMSGTPLVAGKTYIWTTVWDGTNSYSRTNGVDYCSGNAGGSAAFGCGNYGFQFGQSTGTTPYYIGRFGVWGRRLTTNEIQAIECQWAQDYGISTPCLESLLPSGMMLRWESSDLSPGYNSIWTDRIMGYSWFQTNSNNRIYKDVAGAQFYGTNFLVATNIIVNSSPGGTNWNSLVVAQFRDVSVSQYIMGDTLVGGHIYYAMSVPGSLYHESIANNWIKPIGTETNVYINCQVASGSNYGFYTNGIINVGTVAVTYNDLAPVTRVGADASGGSFYKGMLRKVLIWTNQPVWNATTISNVNYYGSHSL